MTLLKEQNEKIDDVEEKWKWKFIHRYLGQNVE
jgi:hypothetical protein